MERALARERARVPGRLSRATAARHAADEWHRDLLDQMALEIPGVRPRSSGRIRESRCTCGDVSGTASASGYDEAYPWDRMLEPLSARARAAELLPDFFSGVERVVHQIIRALEAAPPRTRPPEV